MTRSLAESLGGGDVDELALAWARDFLARAGFPITGPNLQVVYSWAFAESGGGGGMWNPLNTTQTGYPGESPYNDNGGFPVMNYARRDDGLAANAKVIHNGHYGAAVTAFLLGNNAPATVAAITSSPWGTRHITLLDPPGPPPVPVPPTPPEVLEMQVIALPQKGSPAGRTALAVWDPAHPNRIALENGARLEHDQQSGVPGVRTWAPRDANGASVIPAGHHGIGISPIHGHLGAITGVVLACTGANTYVAELP